MASLSSSSPSPSGPSASVPDAEFFGAHSDAQEPALTTSITKMEKQPGRKIWEKHDDFEDTEEENTAEVLKSLLDDGLLSPEDFEARMANLGLLEEAKALSSRAQTPERRLYEATPHGLSIPSSSTHGVSYEPCRTDIRPDGQAFALEGLLSPEESQHFIEAAEQAGMTSVSRIGYRQIRVCDRVAAFSDEAADWLFQRCCGHLEPIVFGGGQYVWTPVGLNPTFRLVRYAPGGYFWPHRDDGFVEIPGKRQSFRTFMLYLNSEFEGGPTNFYDDSQVCYEPGDPAKIIHRFKPTTGSCLIFDSNLVHDGGELEAGVKYIMRSEVMYTLNLNT